MGKKLYQRKDVSLPMTEKLGIDGLCVLKASSDKHFFAVHERYFSEEKPKCPACGSAKTRCSKIERRTFKDILFDDAPNEENNKRGFQVFDLTFYQTYFRCDGCNNNVFPEPVDFCGKGCRYTNRLSDALADGTFRFSYKKVCDYFGVPASTASIGPIMRRRIQYREAQMLPLSTPRMLGIIEIIFFREVYPVVFALREDAVYCIDILRDSSEETVLAFLRTLDSNEIDTVFIDPVDSIRSAAAVAFPRANIIVTEECILRYARNAMIEIIHKEGKRFPVKFKDNVLTLPNNRLLNDYQRGQVAEGMKSRPGLREAYAQYQALMKIMSEEWTYNALSDWAHALPDDMAEFEPLVDVIDLFNQEINNYVEARKKLPNFYTTALQAVCDAFKEMPHCIFDVLRARCFLTINHDTIEKDGAKHRLGIHTARLVQNMNAITKNIKEARDYEL